MRERARRALALSVLVAAPAALAAQRSDAAGPEALASWVALDAAPGRERLATDAIRRAAPEWKAGPLGSLVLTRGSGRPRRVVACGLDSPGYVVSEIRPDGYLRLQYDAAPPSHTLWDQFHEGQRVVVHGRARDVAGVTTVRSTHLWRGGALGEEIRTVADLWVDVGARNAREVAALGIEPLDAVGVELRAWPLAGHVAGPFAAQRVSCAAVAAAARGTPARGQTTFVLSAQSAFGWLGLGGVLAQLGEVDSLVVVDAALAGPDSAGSGLARREGVTSRGRGSRGVPNVPRGAAASAIGPRAMHRHTLVESVALDDAAALLGEVARAAGIASGTAPEPPKLPPQRALPPRDSGPDSLWSLATMLASLSDAYGVSGHEAPVREIVRAALPDWARSTAQVDTAGNLVVAAGPERDTVVLVAHMDEVGFEVARIDADGTVHLAMRGGGMPTLWEGRPALLHYDAGDRAPSECALHLAPNTTPSEGPALAGIFAPRATATTRWSGELTAWFGGDAAALARCGVRAGQSITSPKRAVRMGATRFTARALDDRAGSTALLVAIRSIDPARLPRKVIFAWATREEVGLQGAAALAARLGTSVARVHAIDTFVSADSPLESSRFADAPLGDGPVLRALDNSSVTPPAEIDRVRQVAREAHLPLQVGTTNGGTDGTPFTTYGAPNAPLSWPGRYSHSPVEVLDLVDLRALSQLVRALVLTR
jgi:putative aminopeptidase FrvX